MIRAEKKNDVKSAVSRWKGEGLSVGFVPTMGYLHEGHASLIKRAAAENDRVVVSVFVNPLQFDRKEDLERYPRDIERDADIARGNGVDLLYLPESGEIYPEKFSSIVEVGELDRELCGGSRPGHFRGVCTVVNKLFNIVQPERAYFGEKDYQQLAIIKKMVEDLDIPVEIIGCSIVRERSGLALSSRNARLNKVQRSEAAGIWEALRGMKRGIEDEGKDPEKARSEALEEIGEIPGAEVDYLEIVDPESLVKSRGRGRMLVAAAVFVGEVRLIDNIMIEGKE